MWILKIPCLASLSGTGIKITLSIRPLRRIAGSIKSGRFELAITNIRSLPQLFICERNSFTSPDSLELLILLRFGTKASNSSKFSIVGAFFLASSNKAPIFSCEPCTYMLARSDDLTNT